MHAADLLFSLLPAVFEAIIPVTADLWSQLTERSERRVIGTEMRQKSGRPGQTMGTRGPGDGKRVELLTRLPEGVRVRFLTRPAAGTNNWSTISCWAGEASERAKRVRQLRK